MSKKKYKPKTYVLGDLHGAHRALVEVLLKVQFNFVEDTLIFLGDLDDCWGEFDMCLKVFEKIKNFHAIIGNHDLHLMRYLRTNEVSPNWLRIGGDKTLAVIEKNPQVREDLDLYFKNASYYHIIRGKLFCHGGVNHTRPITKQRKRNFAINRQMYGIAKKYQKQKLKFQLQFDEKNTVAINEIFVGHSTTKTFKPVFRSNLTNVDTGAGSVGYLTLMDVDKKTYVQSTQVSKLYNKNGA